jgi:hypothetical protein
MSRLGWNPASYSEAERTEFRRGGYRGLTAITDPTLNPAPSFFSRPHPGNCSCSITLGSRTIRTNTILPQGFLSYLSRGAGISVKFEVRSISLASAENAFRRAGRSSAHSQQIWGPLGKVTLQFNASWDVKLQKLDAGTQKRGQKLWGGGSVG